MATSVASNYTKTQRKKAAKILQGAHDLIESEGFDINDWGGWSSNGAVSGPFCYIGAVRAAAKVDTSPLGRDATAGDGPELVLALEVLDELARSRFPRLRDWLDEDRVGGFEVPTGRYIETLGYAVERKLRDKDIDRVDTHAKRDALKMLRKALTELYESGDLQ